MTLNPKDHLDEQLKQLASGPRHPDRFYVPSKYRYTDIYAIAAGIRKAFFSSDREETVCFCVMDKGLAAAAVLAAMTCPVTLVIPHSFSESAISDMYQAIPFARAMTDQAISFPPGVETVVIDPGPLMETKYSCGVVRSPESVFLKLFTGGSTGTPKIWSKTIRNMFGEAFFLADKFNVAPDDRIIPTVPPIHIYGLLYTVLVPLVASAAVRDGLVTFPGEIQRAISEERSTILVSIPIIYRVLNGSGVKRNSLRLAFSSAGKLNPADADAFFAQTGLGVTEIYGSTETGGIAIRCSADGASHYTPYACVDWKINANRLFVRSEFVSPETPRDDDGFMDIGDQARACRDGFQLIGRADRIVKVAGKRVDMEDVKNKIVQLKAVTDAIVFSSNSQTGRDTEIWALVEGTIEKAELRRHLSAELEPYAIPRRIRIVGQIPVSSTGKYNKTTIERMFQTE